jgi:hypothetical protein
MLLIVLAEAELLENPSQGTIILKRLENPSPDTFILKRLENQII